MSVSLDGVGHWFVEGAWLFRGLDLRLLPGRTYALTGPSGSGKSTLLSLIAGWEQPREGRIAAAGGRVSWVFQNPTGTPRRSALDLVAYPLLARGASPGDARRGALRTLHTLGLAHVANSPFGSLSGGEAQRLMLARAVSAGPRLLLIDEPTAQLDRSTAATVNDAIRTLANDGAIVVIATHDASTRDACTDVVDLATVDTGRRRG